MTVEHAIITMGKAGIVLSALCVFWFWPAREYCVDLFRQQMFELRDRLFDEARTGAIGFDHPAYATLRGAMNGFVRFGHRLGAVQLLVIGFGALVDPVLSRDEAFEKQWEKGLRQLSRPAREMMQKYRSEMVRLVLWHILRMSPLFSLLVILPVGLLISALVLLLVARAGARRLWDRLVGGIESTALAYGES